MFYGSTAQPRSNSKCLSKLSFKRVRKATAAFRRLGELVTPKRKEELKQTYEDQGVFNFNEQTAEVHPRLALLSITPLLISTPHPNDTIVRKPSHSGEFSAPVHK
jgi:hypothetical protein